MSLTKDEENILFLVRILFASDIGIGMLLSCVQDISRTSGRIETKFAWI